MERSAPHDPQWIGGSVWTVCTQSNTFVGWKQQYISQVDIGFIDARQSTGFLFDGLFVRTILSSIHLLSTESVLSMSISQLRMVRVARPMKCRCYIKPSSDGNGRDTTHQVLPTILPIAWNYLGENPGNKKLGGRAVGRTRGKTKPEAELDACADMCCQQANPRSRKVIKLVNFLSPTFCANGLKIILDYRFKIWPLVISS